MSKDIYTLTNQRFGRLLVVKEAAGLRNGLHRQWECRCDCGNTFIATGSYMRAGTTKSCGCLRSPRGSNSPNWTGGRTKSNKGYVQLTIYPDGGPRKRVYEHIVVMEHRLGRKLFLDEEVHHKNGIRSDNQDDNLELRVKSKHPKGALPEDLVIWAKEILHRYDSK